MHEMADRRACGQELLHEAEELPEAEEQDGGVLEAIASEYEAVFTQLNSLIKDQNDRIADRLSQFLPKEPADEEERCKAKEDLARLEREVATVKSEWVRAAQKRKEADEAAKRARETEERVAGRERELEKAVREARLRLDQLPCRGES